MKNYIKVKHSGNAGDIVYSLSSMYDYCTENNCKIVYYIKIGVPSGFTDETHPTGAVMMNDFMFDFLAPLLKAQPYIHEVIKVGKDENVLVDYDLECDIWETKKMEPLLIFNFYSLDDDLENKKNNKITFVEDVLKALLNNK